MKFLSAGNESDCVWERAKEVGATAVGKKKIQTKILRKTLGQHSQGYRGTEEVDWGQQATIQKGRGENSAGEVCLNH